jgi:hypothetical protein
MGKDRLADICEVCEGMRSVHVCEWVNAARKVAVYNAVAVSIHGPQISGIDEA